MGNMPKAESVWYIMKRGQLYQQGRGGGGDQPTIRVKRNLSEKLWVSKEVINY